MLPWRPLPLERHLQTSLSGARKSPELSQTFDQLLGWPPFMGDVIRLVFHGGTAYLGIAVGLKEGKSLLGILGWFLGVGNGIGAACDAVSLLKRAAGTHPPETREPA